MGTATLGFRGGPAVAFRIDPDNITWNFEILTSVTETLGGRVIQVIGSYLNDLTVQGSFGQDRRTPRGESWRQAEAFLVLVQQIMDAQAADANRQAQMHPPAVFSYPPKSWKFQVYVKGFSDADNPGTSVVLTPGRFSQRWQLSLFIVQDSSQALVLAGQSGGVVNKQAAAAVDAYMARISDGIGWHFTQYTGVAGAADQARDEAAALKLYPDLKTTAYYQPPVVVSGAASPAGNNNSYTVSASADLTAWLKALLAALGDPETAANMSSLVNWQLHEEPASKWNMWNNPFNSTEIMPGSKQVNSAGVQSYVTLSDGLTATVKTLNNGFYPQILANLKKGIGLLHGAEKDLLTWSGGGYSSV